MIIETIQRDNKNPVGVKYSNKLGYGRLTAIELNSRCLYFV